MRTDPSDIRIRAAQDCDLPYLHAINEAATPGVGAVGVDDLARLIGMAHLVRVADAGAGPLGFILCMVEGCGYQSLNYRWLTDRYPAFVYCDRIAVAAAARGRGIGERLYADAWQDQHRTRPVLLCEVNLMPPNPGSMRFHERLGFRRIGERWNAARSYGVAYLEKPLN